MKLLSKCLLSLRNKLKLKGNYSLDIAEGVRIRGCTIVIKGKNNLLRIASGVNLKDVQIEILGDDCVVSIDEGCVIGESCYLSARESGTQLTLGKNCMLSRNVKIMTSDGHNIMKSGQRINPAKSIKIGNHVWLADNVTVLKGVQVGDDCVVGINSTLTKSVSAGSIAAGAPAKVLVGGVTWQNELTY